LRKRKDVRIKGKKDTGRKRNNDLREIKDRVDRDIIPKGGEPHVLSELLFSKYFSRLRQQKSFFV